MGTALRMEVTPATVIQAVKKMKKKERLIFLEDLMAATSPAYLRSIREARRDYKAGKVKSHADAFVKLSSFSSERERGNLRFRTVCVSHSEA